MTDVSRVLRAARERAGASLEEVSASTKIKLTFLQAIERGEFERLPGEFFTRAFLRTYARELQLSPDAIVQAYDASRIGAELPEHDASEDSGPESNAVAPGIGEMSGDRVGTPTGSFPRMAWPAAALALLLVAVISVTTRPVPGDASGNETGAVGTTGSEAAAVASPAPRAEAEPEMLTLEIRASGVTWVAATADGQRAVYQLLQPGDRLTVEARNAFSIRLGNAAAFEYSINGVDGRALGREGEVRDVQITRDNYRTFLR